MQDGVIVIAHHVHSPACRVFSMPERAPSTKTGTQSGNKTCIAQPYTTLLDCKMHLMQHLYDPGILTSSANQCILGKVYLRSNLSGNQQHKQTHAPFKAAKSHHQVPAAQWVCEMDQDAASAE